MNLKDNIKTLGITYKMNSARLEKLGVMTVEDLILHIPFRYENLTLVSRARTLQIGETATVKGVVIEAKNIFTKNGKRIQLVMLQDESGDMLQCIWFNQIFLLKIIKQGINLSVAGKIIFFLKKITMLVNEYEIIENLNSPLYHTGRLVPIYPETHGLSSKWIRNRIKDVLPSLDSQLEEYLPDYIINKYKLIDYKTAIKQIHFPENMEISSEAKTRLSFDELFLIQLAAAYRRTEWEKQLTTYTLDISKYKQKIQGFWDNLTFKLTTAQKNAVHDIFRDLSSNKPMNRLLEGDVGSGKTVVATIAAYVTYLNGLQTAFMAPTEILAKQHFDTISSLLCPLGVKVALFTSESNKKDKNKKVFNIAVGTHALLDKSIQFTKLGFVVIDEQQRFGVEQRSILRDKGINPHFLTMTATPIPRTIFLTLYGDLDLSYLDEMPKGRQKIKTWLVPQEKRNAGYEWIKQRINEKDENGNKNQVFIICPFIEESENAVTVKAAVKEYQTLKDSVFKDYKLGLLHGKLKSKEKEEILKDFRDQKIDVLVATPVVEVGIDIPNATIMMIEASERFGLAQLHQLRGRVGRNQKQSYCLLFTEARTPKTVERLKYMERTHAGAELAEFDLRLRGPGEVFGVMQHGVSELKIASFSDFGLIEKTKIEIENLFPKISQFPKLIEKVKSYKIENISPD